MTNNKKIGLALGGGGARGIAHIGAIKVMQKADIQVDYLAGSSMGSIIAAFLALGKDWNELEKELVSYSNKKRLGALFDFAKVGQAVFKGRKVKKFLKEQFGEAEFKDTKIPLQIISCNLATGKEIVIKQGKLVDAMMASISVPGIFPPVKIGDKIMIDGSVVNPTPVDVVKKMGADIVIGIDLIDKNVKEIKEIPNLINTLLLAFEIIRKQSVAFKLKDFNGDLVMVRPEHRSIVDSFKFFNIDIFIKSGEDAMAEALPTIKKLIEN